VEDAPTAVLVRQVLGAMAQFEKAALVAKLKAARDRKRVAAGKCEGRKSWAEINPELVREAMLICFLSNVRDDNGLLTAVTSVLVARTCKPSYR
jgi:predicted NAD-dependent protein-ADP-ribosyltransferase YbiA (DUF1768 family)